VAHGTLDRVDNGHLTLTFVLKTASADPREVVETIEVPVGMTATAITLSSADGEPVRSLAFETEQSKTKYDRIVAQIKDPALLEYVSPRRAILHVFPVSRAQPATIVVELTATGLAEAGGVQRLGPTVSFVAAPQLDVVDRPSIRYASRGSSVPKVDDERLAKL
jgi:hypothetical protein